MEEAQIMLEEVYRAAPVPEDYMKYQLHLSTGMEVPQIELWFQNRRSRDGGGSTPAEGIADWSAVQRPMIQITSGAERLPSNSGQRRPGRPDLAQPPKALEVGARANTGAGLLPRISSQGALLASEQHAQVADHPEHSRGLDSNGNSMQAFPFPELHTEPEGGSPQCGLLQEGQLAVLPALDWLSENPTSDAMRRPETLGAGAARLQSGALIDTSIGDPAELLSQTNAPFLLNFLHSSMNREQHGHQGLSKDSAPGTPNNGGFKAPAAPSEQQGLRHQRSSGSEQVQIRSADRPPPTPGSMRQAQSPRQSLLQAHRQQPQQQLQRLGPAEGQHGQRPWLNHMDAPAQTLDCRDVLPPGSSSPEWHGQMLTTIGGSMPVGVSRQWRQNWGHMGTQGFADPDVVYSVSMTSSMESSRDALSMRHSEASQQMEELEHGQILERGTVSLPTMQNFRQELLKGAPWPPTDGGRPPAQGGDLANWRRPGTVSSEDAPGEAPQTARRPGALPRSISDISETHSLQGYASLKDHGSATDANLVSGDGASAGADPENRPEARFVEADLESVVGLIGLQTINSVQEYDGSRQLYLFEQLTHLDSLDINTSASHPSKRRRVRHQHFWRNSDKLPPDHRLYVPSADIKQALEESEPVRGRRQITSAERTNMWSVCLTSKGVLNYLNRRISPVGVRLFRASQRQVKGGPAGPPASDKPLLPPTLAPKPKPLISPAAAHASDFADADDDLPAGGTRKRRSRLRRDSS